MPDALLQLIEAREKLVKARIKIIQEIDALNLTKAHRDIVIREILGVSSSVDRCIEIIQSRN
ncbi:hypothetical protein WM008_20455 [Vibrio vulnificus]|uniref:hypothetical protein n=1 Tax=Vibrio vulnificus TaxID=672 RepID=UPI0030EBD100